MISETLFKTNLEGMELLAQGKVRDLYPLGNDLLLVATDRISAFDVVMDQPIPEKGKVLTTISSFWFRLLAPICPNHFLSCNVDSWEDLPGNAASQLRHRTMRVKKTDPLPVEFVVRGYLTGSGWKEYQEKGSVCGVALPKGLSHAEKLPEPILTPTTKATEGHDEAIDFEKVKELVGLEVAEKAKSLSLELFKKAHAYALTRQFVLADTKLEFGLIGNDLLLIDEIFTPDSSRYWPADKVEPGAHPPSFDKQVLRDWLSSSGWEKEPPPPTLTAEVIEKTATQYRTICARLTGLSPEGLPLVDLEKKD